MLILHKILDRKKLSIIAILFATLFVYPVHSSGQESQEFDVFDVESVDLPDTTIDEDFSEDDFPVPEFTESYDFESGDINANLDPLEAEGKAKNTKENDFGKFPPTEDFGSLKESGDLSDSLPSLDSDVLNNENTEVELRSDNEMPDSSDGLNDLEIDSILGDDNLEALMNDLPLGPEENKQESNSNEPVKEAGVDELKGENTEENIQNNSNDSLSDSLRGYLNSFLGISEDVVAKNEINEETEEAKVKGEVEQGIGSNKNSQGPSDVGGENTLKPKGEVKEVGELPEERENTEIADSVEKGAKEEVYNVELDGFQDLLNDADSMVIDAKESQPELSGDISEAVNGSSKVVKLKAREKSAKEVLISNITKKNPDISEGTINKLAGDCLEIIGKIKKCEKFTCSMPSFIKGKDVKMKQQIKPLPGGGCELEVSNAKSSDNIAKCELEPESQNQFSQKIFDYFSSSGKNKFLLKESFSNQCKFPEKKVIKEVESSSISNSQPKIVHTPAFIPKPLQSPLNKTPWSEIDIKNEVISKKTEGGLSNDSVKVIRNLESKLIQEKNSNNKKVEKESFAIERGYLDFTEDLKEEDGVLRSPSNINLSIKSPKKGSGSFDIDKKMEEAYRALLSGQISASIQIYKNILSHKSGYREALFGLATAYHRNSQFEQARSIYVKILDKDPDDQKALNNFLVLVSQESPENALIELERLEQINSNFSPIQAQIGMINLKLNKPEIAEKYLLKALSLSPNNATYKYNLAVISDRLNKERQAITLYKQLLEDVRKGASIPGSVKQIKQRLNFLEDKIKIDNLR